MLLLAWAGLQVLSFSGDFEGARLRGGAVAHPPLTLLLALVPAGVVTFAVALAVRLARRTPAGTRGWAVHLAVHAACAAALAAALLGIRLAARATLASPTPALAAARDADEASGFALLFLVAAGLAHAVVYAGRFRRKEAMELRLQASLSRAELERASAELRMLKMQLNPHFLFNSLHAVAALIGDAPEAAERLVVRLSELLRHAMRSVGTQEVPLEEEMETVRPFVEIEAERLGGRLAVEWDVEEEALDALVPHMVLQPLVENAVKHGLEPRAGGGRLRIAARREGEWLVVEVEDDGVGLETAAGRRTHGAGLGSENLRARLDQLYGGAASFALESRAGGTVARLRLPLHESPAELRPVPLPMRDGDVFLASPSPARTVAVDGGYSPAIGRVGRVAAAAWLVGMWANGFGVRNGLRTEGGHVVTAAQALVCAGINAALWTLLGVAAFVATRRHPFSGVSWRSSLRVHAAVGLGLAAVIATGRAVCHAWIGFPPGRWSTGAEAFGMANFLAMYLVLVGLAHAVEYAQRDRQKQVAELRLQASLSRAELERTSAELRMLKMQLNPHFLFNSLHAVAALIGDAPEAAERLVVRLSELLRQAMRSVGTQEVPLEEEMETLRPFVDIETERLGGRLAVEWVVEEEALDALVPHMVLQPLVENAVKHGLEPRAGGGRLRIAARREGEWLVGEVEDDGVGLETAAGRRTHGAGVGSENLRARLGQLYGGAASLALAPRAGGGTVAGMRIPWHLEAAPPTAARAVEPERAESR